MNKSLFIFFACLAMNVALKSDPLNDLERKYRSTKEEARWLCTYYGPYVFAGLIGASGFFFSGKAGVCTTSIAGMYGMYRAAEGFLIVRDLRQKYARPERVTSHWQGMKPKAQRFMFARWRQMDDYYGDGYYWPTVWSVTEEKHNVVYYLYKDILSHRIVIKLGDYDIVSPTPLQVIEALKKEIEEIESDLRLLEPYTNINRVMEQPEEFRPDHSYWRIFWPNYNRASQCYVELVVMLKRLYALIEIVSEVRMNSSKEDWPAYF